MKPQQVGIYLLILFAIFFVVTDPSTAGEWGRDFFGWLGDGLGNALDFLDELFGDDAPPPTTTVTDVG